MRGLLRTAARSPKVSTGEAFLANRERTLNGFFTQYDWDAEALNQARFVDSRTKMGRVGHGTGISLSMIQSTNESDGIPCLMVETPN